MEKNKNKLREAIECAKKAGLISEAFHGERKLKELELADIINEDAV